MSLFQNILNRLKRKIEEVFHYAGSPPEIFARPDVPTAPGPPLGGRTHDSMPDPPGEENRPGTHIAVDERPEGRVNGATPVPVRSDRERIIGERKHTAPNDTLGALDLERQSTNRQGPSDWQDVGDVDSSERVPEIRVINPSMPNNLSRRARGHRAAAGNKDNIMISGGHFTQAESVVNSVNNARQHAASNDMLGAIDPDTAPMQMLHGNVVISGGHFTQAGSVVSNLNHARPKALKYLQKRVAPAAIHVSAQCVDPPRCHPDTRIAILQEMYDWITQSGYREQWLLWLNGAAGAGKSALMQSLAKRCTQAAIAIASFFIFRGDSTRNTIAPLVATLVYQLIQAIPEISEDILLVIERNPLVFSQSLESQVQQLIIHPLLRLPPHLGRLFVVFIDGLDECNDRNVQADLIRALGNIASSKNIPVVFLIASRREPQIEAEFVRKPISKILKTLPLDNSDIEQTSDDIRRYLVDKFRDIKETHLLRRYLPTNWPPASSVEEIVSKSSGQFIFASVVINYLSSPRANPAHQLEVIRGIHLRDSSSQNPFAHLDALYQHIFSQVKPCDKVLDILAYILITKTDSMTYIEDAFLLERGELEVLFADLTAVIHFGFNSGGQFGKIKFLHASLPDFLLDETRSELYHIDVNGYRTKLACFMLEKRPPTIDPLSSTDDLRAVSMEEIYALERILIFLKGGKLSDRRLRQSFLNFDITFYDADIAGKAINVFLKVLECLDEKEFDNEREVYRHLAKVFAPYFTTHWQDMDDDRKKEIAKKYPELTDRINLHLQERRPLH